MNKFKLFITFAAFSLMILSLPAIASAQWRDRDDDYYGRNGGYNNGRYGDMRSTVRSLKQRTREFQRQVDRDLDNSRVNGTDREDQINESVDRFKDAVNDLDDNPRQNDQRLRRVLDLGSQLDRTVGRGRLSYQTQDLWRSIRQDLNYLGGNGYYDNNRNSRSNRNNRYPRGGTNNGGYNLPNWWPF